jgi:hypothetical protein
MFNLEIRSEEELFALRYAIEVALIQTNERLYHPNQSPKNFPAIIKEIDTLVNLQDRIGKNVTGIDNPSSTL